MNVHNKTWPFMRRKFGVEIEAFGVAPIAIESTLRKYRINCKIESYTHKVTSHWKITTDSSLRGTDLPFELVSPVLVGEEGLFELERVCCFLNQLKAQTNSQCGFHVHFSLENIDNKTQFWKNVLHNYIMLEKAFDELVDPSRRGNRNRFCKTLNRRKLKENLFNCKTLSDFERLLLPANANPETSIPRYFKINISSYWRYKTIEFRHHHGTVQFRDMANWVRLLDRFLSFSKTYVLSDSNIEPFAQTLSDPLYQYFTKRPKDLTKSIAEEIVFSLDPVNQYRLWLEQLFA